jgi:hypothetical protein
VCSDGIFGGEAVSRSDQRPGGQRHKPTLRGTLQKNKKLQPPAQGDTALDMNERGDVGYEGKDYAVPVFFSFLLQVPNFLSNLLQSVLKSVVLPLEI